MNVTAASSVTVEGIVVISLCRRSWRKNFSWSWEYHRKEDNLSSKMDGIQGELKNRPVARRSIPKSLATASSALQSQDPMVKKRIDDAVALFYVECSTLLEYISS